MISKIFAIQITTEVWRHLGQLWEQKALKKNMLEVKSETGLKSWGIYVAFPKPSLTPYTVHVYMGRNINSLVITTGRYQALT